MPILDYREYARISRQAASEGMVLLENKNNILPLAEGSSLTLLGRVQYDTYVSGTGSGGLVNVPYVVSINDGLKRVYKLEQQSQEDYKLWLEYNPFDEGSGWGQEPWAQKEMVLDSEQVKGYSNGQDTALVVIGRTAGEDRDNMALPGSYYLTETELNLLQLARANFEKLIVVLNTGNIIDTSWQVNLQADALLYMWQGGCETGNALADVLTGAVNPSGKLPDTVAYDLEHHPSTKNFGNADENIYQEDIFVGYRYFETFAPEQVQYPFAHGLSYTNFAINNPSANYEDGLIKLEFAVENTGTVAGKIAPQVYVATPQGALGKAKRVLVDFVKTKVLEVGESETFELEIPEYYFASYDDTGKSGKQFAYVLEAGKYEVYLGFDVRSADVVDSFELHDLKVVEQLETALAPVQSFERISTGELDKGIYNLKKEQVLASVNNVYEDSEVESLVSEEQSSVHYDFQDYFDGKITVEEYLSQFSNDDLIELSRGIGMSPEGVRSGVAGAFGSVSEKLKETGLPLIAVADGPSGIRMDDGSMSFQVPIGTSLAASFNTELNRELFEYLGLELRKNDISSLLGPGMNIHRSPLNGRNFEYFSEDPLLTGKIAAAQIEGLWKYEVAATVKHFVANSQEHERLHVDSVVSERALREIYLKGFELAIRNSNLMSIMSSYNPINGIWSASNKDLHTKVLRDEWKYEGIVMTDWWATMNWEQGEVATRDNLGAMIRAQNDLYMVISPGQEKTGTEEARADLEQGRISRSELLRNARNLVQFIKAVYTTDIEVEVINEPEEKTITEQKLYLGSIDKDVILDPNRIQVKKKLRNIISFTLEEDRSVKLKLVYESQLSGVSQQNITISVDQEGIDVIGITGSEDAAREYLIDFTTGRHSIEIYYSEGGLELKEFALILE